MIHVIAFTGQAGAGKDTAAEYLADFARFERVAFADALRAEVAAAFDLPPNTRLLQDRSRKEQPLDALALRNCSSFCFVGAIAMALHATVNAEWLDAPRSPRQILQWWGTEYRRKEDDRYWVKALGARMGAMRDAGVARFAITDCRFANELAFIRLSGGRLWRVLRADLPAVEGQHASATGLAGVRADVDLVNDGTKEQLRDQVLRHWWATDSGIAADKLHVEVLA